ncbi:hypothetical protein [Marinactinospora rubrisoli]|uniref:Uncharacterized protein n=1 Tax=Marinactinospora rubrisoli TaxID=2715399 RepID=A0ABW2KK96_9ACTN
MVGSQSTARELDGALRIPSTPFRIERQHFSVLRRMMSGEIEEVRAPCGEVVARQGETLRLGGTEMPRARNIREQRDNTR